MKKATYQQVADRLKKAVSTVEKYPKDKLLLMRVGLATITAEREKRRRVHQDTQSDENSNMEGRDK